MRAHEQKVTALRDRYTAALGRAAAGDEGAKAGVNSEIERFKSFGNVPDQTPAGAHAEIARVQNIWRQEHGKLRRQLKEELLKLQPPYIRALEGQKEKFVREGDTAATEAIVAEITRLNQTPETFLSLAIRGQWAD